MLEITSVFDVLAADEREARDTMRKALTLSETRIDHILGHFLKNASSVDEFDARLSLVREDWDWVVTATCEETGYDHPEYIAATLEAHMRPLPSSQARTAAVHEARRIKMCPYHSEVTDISLAAADPSAGWQAMQSHAWGPQHCQGEWEGKCNFKREMTTQAWWDERAQQQEERRLERQEQQLEAPVTEPTDELEAPVDDLSDSEPIDELGEGTGADVIDFPSDGGAEAPEAEIPMAMAASTQKHAYDPSEQHDDKIVPCPQCGGSGKTANNGECSRCHGAGHVSDWGPSTLDKLNSKTAGEGNTDLDGPEPKIDKRLWTPQTVRKEDVQLDSDRFPVKEKDAIEIIRATNEGEPKEIGERTTERVELPTATGLDDAGFASGGQEHGPHTDTWHGKGQNSPVTARADDVDKNPIRELLVNNYDGFVPAADVQRAVSSL